MRPGERLARLFRSQPPVIAGLRLVYPAAGEQHSATHAKASSRLSCNVSQERPAQDKTGNRHRRILVHCYNTCLYVILMLLQAAGCADFRGFGRIFPHAYGAAGDEYLATRLTLRKSPEIIRSTCRIGLSRFEDPHQICALHREQNPGSGWGCEKCGPGGWCLIRDL